MYHRQLFFKVYFCLRWNEYCCYQKASLEAETNSTMWASWNGFWLLGVHLLDIQLLNSKPVSINSDRKHPHGHIAVNNMDWRWGGISGKIILPKCFNFPTLIVSIYYQICCHLIIISPCTHAYIWQKAEWCCSTKTERWTRARGMGGVGEQNINLCLQCDYMYSDQTQCYFIILQVVMSLPWPMSSPCSGS